MATINHKKYDEATETFKDFYVYDGKETLIFKVDGENHKVEITGTLDADNITGSGIIKTSDNGPLSGTAKYLSDGLGNDSKLALSTTQVGVGTTSLSAWSFDAFQVEGASIWSSGNDLGLNSNSYYDGLYKYRAASAAARMYFDTDGSMFFANAAAGTAGNTITFNERMRITSAGDVAIGSATTSGYKLYVAGDTWRNGTIHYTDGQSIFRTSGGASEVMRITSSGNVGIGTSSPTELLSVTSATSNGIIGLRSGSATYGAFHYMTNGTGEFYVGVNNSAGSLVSGIGGAHGGFIASYNSKPIGFGIDGSEAMRITPSGNVGIGTTNPFALTTNGAAGAARALEVSGNGSSAIRLTDSSIVNGYLDINTDNGVSEIGAYYSTSPTININAYGSINFKRQNTTIATITAQGLTFNGDTAAANALDDYEEGTFSPTIEGSSSAGTATYVVQSGRYTKIGNQISISIDLSWNSGTGTGALRIANLPFANVSNNNAASIGFIDQIALTASNIATAYVAPSSSRIDFVQTPTGGGAVSDVTYDAAGRIIVAAVYYNS